MVSHDIAWLTLLQQFWLLLNPLIIWQQFHLLDCHQIMWYGIQGLEHLAKATTPNSTSFTLTLLPICSWTHTCHLKNGSYLIVPLNATWTTDLWRTGFSTTLLISICTRIEYELHSTTLLQLIPHWFSLEMIHTSTHPISPTNTIPTLHPTLYKTQSEFSEIHPNSFSNRTIRSVIQSIQSNVNQHTKLILSLPFSLSPFQNNQMNV